MPEFYFTFKSSRYAQARIIHVYTHLVGFRLCITLSIKQVMWTKCIIFTARFVNNRLFC